ncbi:MAG: glutamine amidotransferase class-I [Schlesneria sp.]|nr:glutamine amidotransferase class-I [Schlesneria sp.]
MKTPLIGITVDNLDTDRYVSNIAYSQGIAEAGGLPLLLPQDVELAASYVELCDGIVLTGGPDARLEGFGIARHPLSECIEPRRQVFEMALLDALAKKPERPVLGICLGMQLISLHAGGRMNQHLQDVLSAEIEEHQHNNRHRIVVDVLDSALLRTAGPSGKSMRAGGLTPEEARGLTSPAQEEESVEAGLGDTTQCNSDLRRLGGSLALPEEHRLGDVELSDQTVVSSHHQAVDDAGGLRVVARSPAGVIETVDDPARFFYLGVQWHPERGEGLFNRDLLRRFVDVCRS